MKSKALLALLIMISFPLLSACSNRELDAISLVISLGIDKDEAGYMVTYQVLNTKTVSSQKSVNESAFVLYKEKGKDLGEIEKRITSQASRMMYLAHVRSIIIGEDVAREGLNGILDYLTRSHGFRSDYYFIIAKGATANQILNTVTAVESVSGRKLYNSIENSKEWWASINSLKVYELINDINAKGKNPVLIGVELYDKTEDMDSIKGLEKSETVILKLTDLAVFRDDKLIGWLNEEDGRSFHNIVGKSKKSVNFVDYDKNTHVSVDIINSKRNIKVSLLDGEPVINVMFSIVSDISTVAGNVDFTEKENQDKLINLINEKFTDVCIKTLNKAQQEFKTDIFGFGESIHRKYPKVWNELKDNWDTEFTKLQVNFMFDTKIRDLGLIYKSIEGE